MKVAFITGITGQDGSYLTELLLEKGYEVHGLIRRSSSFNTGRIEHLYKDPHIEGVRLFLHYGDLTDASSITNLILKIDPDEVYHLGAQSHVAVSFDCPSYTVEVNTLGTLNLLQAIRHSIKKVKFYNAASSEMFGKVLETPQTERTPFNPRSPYACAKVFSFYQTKNYREAYNMFCCNGILFNHESERRGETFVTRKITRAVTRIVLGLQDKLYLGNLDAKRDWGHSKDYVEAMYMMMQIPVPADYVISTGETHSVREFVDNAFGYYDLDYNDYVEIDKKYIRPSEVNMLLGDSSLAKLFFNWEPKIKFNQLVEMMCESDMKLAEEERLLQNGS